MTGRGIRTPHIWLPNRGDARTDVLFKAPTVRSAICAGISLGIMGKIREKEKIPTTELNVFLSKKIFDGKQQAHFTYTWKSNERTLKREYVRLCSCEQLLNHAT